MTRSPSITLGVCAIGHDLSLTLLGGNGVPLIVAEEERYSRVKQGSFVLSPALVWEVLDEVGVAPDEVRDLAVANVSALMERRPDVALTGLPMFGHARVQGAMVDALSRRLVGLESVQYHRHHRCHAASAFLASPFDEAAIVTVDGMGETETATIAHGRGTTMTTLWSSPHPRSLGYAYQALATWAGMTGSERQGKFMGLAAHGTPTYVDVLREAIVLRVAEDGFVLAPPLLTARCNVETWVQHCERTLGPRRREGEELTRHHIDIAASMQVLTEELLLELLRRAHELTGERACAAAGGVFMNSVANGRLRREGPFREFWVQPLAQDNGLSLGAALLSHAARGEGTQRWRMRHAYLGSDIDAQAARAAAARAGIPARRSIAVAAEVAEALAAGRLVAWVSGRAEVGPRALGHRSLFADPRRSAMRDEINRRVKLREDWRPFAPVVLAEDAPMLFGDPRESPFMTFASPALPDSPIPAALHVDGSARVQTVAAADDPGLRALLLAFKSLTGVGCLLNTSLNSRGEPIVRTADDAVELCVASGIDLLAVDDLIVELPPGADRRRARALPPPPQIRLADLDGVLAATDAVAVLDLGPAGLREAVLDAVGGSREVHVLTPKRGRDGRRFEDIRLCDGRELFPAIDLPHGSLIVTLPVSVDLADELLPTVLMPLRRLAGTDPGCVWLVDHWRGLARLSVDGARGVVAGEPVPTEIEAHWIGSLEFAVDAAVNSGV